MFNFCKLLSKYFHDAALFANNVERQLVTKSVELLSVVGRLLIN